MNDYYVDEYVCTDCVWFDPEINVCKYFEEPVDPENGSCDFYEDYGNYEY